MIHRFRAFVVIWALIPFTGVEHVSAQSALQQEEVLDRVIAQEQELTRSMAAYSPLVETYIQNLAEDDELGVAPKSDKYFLGKLNFSSGFGRSSFLVEEGFLQGIRDSFSQLFSVKYLPDGFAQMILIDSKNFDRSHYSFEYIRSEFLGEVRCLVFDVNPASKTTGGFTGRIWVEDRDYNIVRFNGVQGQPEGPLASKLYFHFDSWREQMGPRLWLPSYVYSEESEKKVQFKAQTRIWGYNLGRARAENEFTSLTVDSGRVEDNGDVDEHTAPVTSLRTWERQAEDNVLERMERAGLLAPSGNVDKVLETVISNLEITNNLSIEPPVRARIVLTSPLESFTVGHTIVLSRGLIDVLPDEASLAMVLAHELGHIVLGHRFDTKYAFHDRMRFDDPDMFQNLQFKRTEKEEKQADRKAVELLRESPYQEKLGSAGLFLRALSDKSKRLPSLLRGRMGNGLTANGDLLRMPELMKSAPTLDRAQIDQIAALPLGGRIRMNPWDNTIELVKTKAVGLQSASEKMQFEIAPVYLYLSRQGKADEAAVRSTNN